MGRVSRAQVETVELDLDRYELRLDGRRVPLERIPMELLILLAKARGALVTREGIVEALWGKNPYLDPDTNINMAVHKIRQALRDDPDRPRFVETIVGKGYRFIAPVRRAGTQDNLAENKSGVVLISSASNPELAASIHAESLNHSSQVVQSSAAGPQLPAGLLTAQQSNAGSDLPATQTPEPKPSPAWLRAGWVVVVAAAAVAAVAIALLPMWRDEPPTVQSFAQITHDDHRKVFQIGDLSLPIVTDGSRLYFTVAAAGGRFEVGEVAAAGGESGILATPVGSPAPLDVLPDRSGLLLASPAGAVDAPVWVQPIPEGSPHRMADILARSAVWSPIGDQIAFSSLNVLYTANRDGANRKALLELPDASGQRIYWPRWSPDGKRLRFSIKDPKTSSNSIWEISADGANLHAVLPGWNGSAGECCGSWMPGGSFFVFVAPQNGRQDLWALPERAGLFGKTRQPVQLTSGPLDYSAPLPAADGKSIFVAGKEDRGELVRYDSGSGTFVPFLSGISASGADFSRDGKWVAYVSYPDQTLWRMQLDGGAPLQLTFPPLQTFLPRWSPDGRQIAFHARVPGHASSIYVVSAQGGTPERLTPDGHNDLDPGWSTDGGSLIFERAPWKDRGSPRDTEIDWLDLKSHRVSLLQDSKGLASPRLSPDGRYVLAMPADSSALMLFDRARRKWSKLAGVYAAYPNWSPDGRYIYFDRVDKPGIDRVRLGDGSIEQIASIAGHDRLWTLDTWTALAPDGSPMLLRDVGLREIYALTLSLHQGPLHWPGR